MKTQVSQCVAALVAAAALIGVTTAASNADDKFPTRPISIIVSWAPGGVSHNDAVFMQPLVSKALNTQVEVVNKPGGGGTIGWNFAANAPADGYTIAQTNPAIISTKYSTSMSVDLDRFEHLSLGVKVPYALVVPIDGWKTLAEFLTYAKANPEKVQLGITGIGTLNHLGTLRVEAATGTKFTSVPFKGSGPIYTAILGGHISGTFVELSTAMPMVEANKLRVLAISDSQRSEAVPDVPTFKELGYDVMIATWQGYSVPKGTPKDRVEILRKAFNDAKNTPEFKAFYQKQGGAVTNIAPDDLRSFYQNEDKILKGILDANNIKLN